MMTRSTPISGSTTSMRCMPSCSNSRPTSVRRHRAGLAPAANRHRRRDTVLDEPAPHRIGAPLRELLVVLVVALSVGMTLDQDRGLGIGLQYGDDLFECRRGLGPKVGLVKIEQHIGREADL